MIWENLIKCETGHESPGIESILMSFRIQISNLYKISSFTVIILKEVNTEQTRVCNSI